LSGRNSQVYIFTLHRHRRLCEIHIRLPILIYIGFYHIFDLEYDVFESLILTLARALYFIPVFHPSILPFIWLLPS